MVYSYPRTDAGQTLEEMKLSFQLAELLKGKVGVTQGEPLCDRARTLHPHLERIKYIAHLYITAWGWRECVERGRKALTSVMAMWHFNQRILCYIASMACQNFDAVLFLYRSYIEVDLRPRPVGRKRSLVFWM